MFKAIFSILDQNFDHGDYICMKLKKWEVLNGHFIFANQGFRSSTHIYLLFTLGTSQGKFEVPGSAI